MIIGISGKKGSGKDTFAVLLQKHLNNNYIITSFAESIKLGLSVMFNIPLKDLNDPVIKNNYSFCDKTYRELFISLGTEWGRKMISPNIWIIALASKYKDKRNLIISDVRFNNELKWIESKKGLIVRIESDRAIPSSHISETELDNYPFEIYITNNSNLEDLEEKAKEVANYIKAMTDDYLY